MKLNQVDLRFVPNQRPQITVKFLEPMPSTEDLKFHSRFHRESGCWLFRADVGDLVVCGANLGGTGAARIRLADGTHTNMKELSRTNGPAVNAVFNTGEFDPVIDVMIHKGAGLDYGHVNAISLAKWIWLARRDVALAVVEWPQGLRLYEPVQIDDDNEPVPNRTEDIIKFVWTPGNPPAANTGD